MLRLNFFRVLILACLASVSLAQGTGNETVTTSLATESIPPAVVTSDIPTTITSPVPRSTQTSAVPTTSYPTSTTTTTTTTQAPETTTKAPETTTTAPETTTKAPDTTTTAPDTTTKAPETTTTHVTSSTPSPPSYPGNRGAWAVSNEVSPDSNCILFEGAFRLEVNILNATINVDIPKDAKASGSCESKLSQSLSLTWNLHVNNVQVNAAMEILFEMNNATHKYTISSLNGSTDSELLPINFVSKLPQPLEVSNENSFSCHSEQKWVLSSEESSSAAPVTLLLDDLQFEAFRSPSKKGKTFSDPELCSGDARQTITIVGLIIGGILATVVILTTALYLGRRYGWCTRRASGYQPLDGGLE